MEIITFAKRIVWLAGLAYRQKKGVKLVTFLRRYRELSPTKWKYWQSVCEMLRAQIRALLEAPINKAFLEAAVLVYKLIHFFAYANLGKDTATESEFPKAESSRDPPKGFVPLPDTEIGGCARNDSLIAPAI